MAGSFIKELENVVPEKHFYAIIHAQQLTKLSALLFV